MSEESKKDTLWGNTLGAVAAVASIPVGLAKGAYNAANGESFEEGVESIVGASFESAKQFGNDNSGFLTGGVASAVAGFALTILTGGNHRGR